jgi:hypothetical protein
MASRFPDRDSAHEWRADRSARFWKKASEMYSQACTANSEEARALYMQIAMAWASLADEVERPPTGDQSSEEPRARH